MKALVADPSPDVRKLTKACLEELGYALEDVLEADDGAKALAWLKAHPADIDLILVDLMLPGTDGLSFLRHVRMNYGTRDIPLVMMSFSDKKDQMAEAPRWGAKGTILKPFTWAALRETIKQVRWKIEVEKSERTSVVLKAIAASASAQVELPFLLQLPAEVVKEFNRLSRSKVYEAGKVLLIPEQVATALHVIGDGEVELVDPRYPGAPEVRGPGECFGEVSFLQSAPAGVTARARTRVEVMSLARIEVSDMARRFQSFGYYLGSQLVRQSRRREALEAAEPAAAELAGNLDALPISDLVQILNACRKTGCLTLNRSGRLGELYFEEGEMTHARAGSLRGEDAFYEVVAWIDATFNFDSGRKSPEKTIHTPAQPLLMEAMRRLDESQRGH
jgi:two-component system chemotaxis response regulator CheY